MFFQKFDVDVNFALPLVKDVHIAVLFAYLSSMYSKFEWAENVALHAFPFYKKRSYKERPIKFFNHKKHQPIEFFKIRNDFFITN